MASLQASKQKGFSEILGWLMRPTQVPNMEIERFHCSLPAAFHVYNEQKTAMSEEDRESRTDEIVSLEAIYAEDFRAQGATYHVVIRSESSPRTLDLEFKLPDEYPSQLPPSFSLSAPWLDRRGTKWSDYELEANLANLWEESDRGVVMFSFVEWLRENVLESKEAIAAAASDATTSHNSSPTSALSEAPSASSEQGASPSSASSPPDFDASEVPEIRTGVAITDRKSKFVAHIARVKTMREVDLVVRALKTDRKIAAATHNMVAFRIAALKSRTNETDRKIAAATHNMVAFRIAARDSKLAHENRDDDGETGAGDRMLFLLQKMDLWDVVLVVTRWYGGIHLGPDRFKHITERMKVLIDECLADWPDMQQREKT